MEIKETYIKKYWEQIVTLSLQKNATQSHKC